MNDLAKTIVIPPECVENFVDFADLPHGGHWFGQGIHMAALTHHEVGYSIDYPHSKRHNILYCRSGSYVCEHDGRSVLLRPGEMLVLPAKTRQRFRAVESSDGFFFLLTPEAWYEERGFVPNVVFPCAALADSVTGRIALYYGAADTYVGLAFTTADEVVAAIKENSVLTPEDTEEGLR